MQSFFVTVDTFRVTYKSREIQSQFFKIPAFNPVLYLAYFHMGKMNSEPMTRMTITTAQPTSNNRNPAVWHNEDSSFHTMLLSSQENAILKSCFKIQETLRALNLKSQRRKIFYKRQGGWKNSKIYYHDHFLQYKNTATPH